MRKLCVLRWLLTISILRSFSLFVLSLLNSRSQPVANKVSCLTVSDLAFQTLRRDPLSHLASYHKVNFQAGDSFLYYSQPRWIRHVVGQGSDLLRISLFLHEVVVLFMFGGLSTSYQQKGSIFLQTNISLAILFCSMPWICFLAWLQPFDYRDLPSVSHSWYSILYPLTLSISSQLQVSSYSSYLRFAIPSLSPFSSLSFSTDALGHLNPNSVSALTFSLGFASSLPKPVGQRAWQCSSLAYTTMYCLTQSLLIVGPSAFSSGPE